MNIYKQKINLLFILLSLSVLLFVIYYSYKIFNHNNIEVVIARYNEYMEWLEEEPFDKYPYIVYNKGDNDDYYKTDKFLKEYKLDNVGRETHTYLSHIIHNYNNLANLTIFINGSIESEFKYERAKRLFYEAETSNADIFACILLDKPVVEVLKDLTMENYMSTNYKNNELNPDTKTRLAKYRPYKEWYKNVFNNVNADTKCFTRNSMFAITKSTILKKPKSYYENLIHHVNKYKNEEAVHFFESAWDTVFFPFDNVKYIE